MQRIIYAGLIWILIIHTEPSKAADVETVLRKVGDNVTLECPQVLTGEQYGSMVWKHDNQLLASITASERVDMNNQNLKLKDKIVVKKDRTLVINFVSSEVMGLFSCTFDFTVNSTADSRSSEYKIVVQDKPERPGRPTVSDATSSEVKVSWTAGDDNNSPIENYILTISQCNQDTAAQTLSVDNSARERIIDNLIPYTCYTVKVSARNSIGTSFPSISSNEFYTEEEDSNSTLVVDLNSTTTAIPTTIATPNAVPGNFHATTTTNEIRLTWDKPTVNLNGELLGYLIEYGNVRGKMDTVKIENPDKTDAVLQGMKSFTMYMVSIRVYNSAGQGPVAAKEVQTEEGLPSKPRITHVSNRHATSFYINWEPPLEPNGKLISYKVQWNHRGTVKSRVIAGHLTNPMTAYITDLEPYTSYQIQVAASTTKGQGNFTDKFPGLTEVAAPSAPRNLNLTILDPTSIHVKWEAPAVIYKNVNNYIIKLWDHRGDDMDRTVSGRYTETIINRLTSDSRYHLKVAAVTKTIFKNFSLVGDFTDSIVFVLGEYGNVISTIDSGENAPIQTKETSDDSSISPVLIAVIVLVILVLAIIIGLFIGYRFYTCRRCYQAAYLYLAVPNNGQSVPQTNIIVEEPSEEKQYPDVGVNDFISHVDLMHMDSDIAFAQEFDEINRATTTDKYSFENSNAADNRNKNRYINIVAYDHSRVVLKSDMGRPRQSDYINANYVDGYKKPKAYIATQGPLPSTFSDFWRMVWEQNTMVIVMITNLMEKARRKCDQYWPNDGNETYGNIQVKLTNTVPRAHYTVRIFTLKNLKVKKRHSMKGTNERTVYHYHYTDWPDHGVPDYSLPVLDFVQKSAAHSGPESGPIIVHCSAGVGRTGTYIVIHSMIAQIQDKRSINIPGFTQYIRRQRNYLVQTEDQYIFIHSVLVEYLLGGGDTDVKEERMMDYLIELEQPPSDQLLQSMTKTTLLSKQFQLITHYQPSEADLYAAQRLCNQEKNREGTLLPVNLKRVLLPARPGVEGSDYINASYLQGYERSGEFVVTQHPTEDTMEDFWRMVWDRNSTVIIVLSPMDEEEHKEFWPAKDSSIEVDAGNFRLAMKEGPIEDEDQRSTTYEFILDSIQYDYTLMTRIICVKDWPVGYTDLHKVFDIIVTAHDYVSCVECGPVVVMDRFGGTAAGTFCALWTLRDQLLSEKSADFYQLAKLYHYKRPGILGTEADYFFLHKALAALCRQMSDNPSNSSSSNPHHHHHHHHFVNHNNHNHNSNVPQQNGTLPRASTPHNGNNSNPSGLPRSNTISGSGTTNTINNTTNSTTNNNSVVSNDDNTNDTGGDGESGEGEATSMNDMSSRNSYVVENGTEKIETVI